MVLLSILRDYLQPNRVLITIGLLALFWLDAIPARSAIFSSFRTTQLRSVSCED